MDRTSTLEMDVNRALAVGLFALVPTLGLAACGDDSPPRAEEGTTTMGGGSSASITVTATDLAFSTNELSAPPGDIEVSMTNDGQIEHTFVVEGHEDDLKLDVPRHGDTDTGTITLPAGTYIYFCDVEGHRSAGMEGTLTVG